MREKLFKTVLAAGLMSALLPMAAYAGSMSGAGPQALSAAAPKAHEITVDVRKEMLTESDAEFPFYVKDKATGEGIAASCQVYDAASNTMLYDDVTGGDGGFILKAGQYARLSLPDDREIVISEGSVKGYTQTGVSEENDEAYDYLTVSGRNVIVAGDGAKMSRGRLQVRPIDPKRLSDAADPSNFTCALKGEDGTETPLSSDQVSFVLVTKTEETNYAEVLASYEGETVRAWVRLIHPFDLDSRILSGAYASYPDGTLLDPNGDGNYKVTRMIEDTAPGGWLYEVQAIAAYGFRNETGLTGMDLSDLSLTRIPSSAFSGCSNLASVALPDSVTAIDSYAFQNCTALSSPGWGAGSKLSSIGTYAYSGSGVMDASIPSGVTVIPDSLFSNCAKLTGVSFKGQVTEIGAYAFSECSKLTGVTLPASLASIESYAFQNCTSLTSMTFPAKVTFSGDSWYMRYIMSGCTSLSSVTFKGSIVSVPDSMFYRCSSLKSVSLPSTCKTIGGSAFAYSGITSISLPSGLTSLGSYAFQRTPITSCTIPSGVDMTNANNVFYYCDKLTTVAFNGRGSIPSSACYQCSSLTKVTIGANVTAIGASAFYHCDKLTSVNIPAKVTAIGKEAFESCRALTTVTGMAGMKTIGQWAFWFCSNLTSIPTIPATITSIDTRAFTATGIKTIKINRKENAITGAPWGATNATVSWIGTT